MAPNLVRAQSAYKDIRIHSFHYTHTHTHTHTQTHACTPAPPPKKKHTHTHTHNNNHTTNTCITCLELLKILHVECVVASFCLRDSLKLIPSPHPTPPPTPLLTPSQSFQTFEMIYVIYSESYFTCDLM